MTPPSTSRRAVRVDLPALAILAWISWLAWLALLAGMLATRAWHPHFLPATAIFGALLISTAALGIGGIWRLARGPARLRAATWVLLGVAPLLFTAGHILYGLRAGFGRLLVVDLPLKLLLPFGESIFDLEARFRYPVRTEGDTVVMIAEPSPLAKDQVAAMDRHVRTLRERLGGRTSDRKIHWVRGPLMGMSGRASYGTCLGSPAGETGPNGEPLSHLDRHEVAHCVMNSVVSPIEVDPPSLFVEGWAEANSGRDRGEIRRQVWNLRRSGETRPLRTLVGPGWYHAHAGMAYPQGAVLVDHILDAYGPDKFLELYTQCGPATFDADCRRVLGVDVETLDAACRAEVAREAPRPADVAGILNGLKLGPTVEPEAWRTFTREFGEGAARLAEPYEQSRVVLDWKWSSKGPDRSDGSSSRWDWRRSGASRSLIVEVDDDVGTAWSATPSRSFKAVRRERGGPWRMEDAAGESAEDSYDRAIVEIDQNWRNFVTAVPACLREFEVPEDAARFVVSRLERRQEDGGRRVLVRIERRPESLVGRMRSAECLFDADRDLVALSESQDLGDGEGLRTDSVYEEGGLPFLRSKRMTGSGPPGHTREVSWTIVERRFGPIPPAEFTPEGLLKGQVVAATKVEEAWKDPQTFADYYPAPLVAGAVAIACGLGAGLIGGFRREAETSSTG
ncbi:hypothetical protein [Paludisphaera mucosa]|uniref:Uncharacterized protein n=1 Tax=Paludisphaera mucosa TaxID=3030827 RepID=A0ABT6FDA9_9BACT|nr:hypothetical protein [Paludisphaera mucosa]MDG3005568.1 hypothetical protein [Paludisphaera mucosa]